MPWIDESHGASTSDSLVEPSTSPGINDHTLDRLPKKTGKAKKGDRSATNDIDDIDPDPGS